MYLGDKSLGYIAQDKTSTKAHKKISSCFRNRNAAKRHAIILSTIEIAKKQEFSIAYACESLILGQKLGFWLGINY